jgi:hypothetical protein
LLRLQVRELGLLWELLAEVPDEESEDYVRQRGRITTEQLCPYLKVHDDELPAEAVVRAVLEACEPLLPGNWVSSNDSSSLDFKLGACHIHASVFYRHGERNEGSLRRLQKEVVRQCNKIIIHYRRKTSVKYLTSEMASSRKYPKRTYLSDK